MKLDAFQTGFAFLPMMLFTALVNFSCGWLSRFFNIRTLVVTGAAMSFVGFSLLLLLNDSWTLWQLFIPTMLLGGGTFLGTPVMATLILSEARDADAGAAMLLVMLWMYIGSMRLLKHTARNQAL